MSWKLGLLVVGATAAAAAASCGSDRDAPPAPTAAAALGADVVARAGGLTVSSGTVSNIAAAQRVDAATARDLAIRDALFAAAALDGKLHQAPDTAFATSAVLARSLLHDLQRESEARGDVTDEELEKATARHWIDFDRPESAHVVHAVARFSEKDDAAKKKHATEIAEAIRRAVLASRPDPAAPPVTTDAGATDALAVAFRAAATSVPSEGIDVVVEDLPPIAADSRVIARDGGNMDPDFSKAATALPARGDVSGLVASVFGVHVIMLLDRVPGVSLPVDERRRRVRDEVLIARQRSAEKELLERLRASVQIDPAADSLLGTVSVER